ncbi:MAG: hypothetical protein JWM16_751 [Verrucomicrobiales bacterium]|nr:hypothetical protein [Verrucomicrobiales bacterium]
MLNSQKCVSSKNGEGNFQRVCYVGSLPVEETTASMMFLYRLLETLPPDCVRIIHTKDDIRVADRPDRRLPRVRYDQLLPLFRRGWYFARMRFPRLFWAMLETHSWWQARQAAKALGAFRPDAIVTIHEQFGWLTAAKLARRLHVPLHLLLHDNWFRNIPMADKLKLRFEQASASVYRQAKSRLCISPYMEEEYGRRYGVPGTVLYPFRGANTPRYDSPPESLAWHTAEPLRVAYAGNVFHQGYWEALRHLAVALDSIGGQLLIFGQSREDVVRNGLDLPNVFAQGYVPHLIDQIREHAHVLFLPMTFGAPEKLNMQISFPSKLAEYTAAGLPLLVYGPEYCSAVRWARENPDSAVVATQEGQESLKSALNSFSQPEHRRRLGLRALELGNQYFSFEAAKDVFFHAIHSRKQRVAAPSATHAF